MTSPSTDAPSQWQRTTTRRFLKWLFSWRTIRRTLIGLAVLITVYASFCTEETIRGKHAWAAYRRAAEARGEQLDWKTFIPKPIPDDQNFAATPFIKSWFVRANYGWKSDYYQQARDHVPSLDVKEGNSPRRFLDLVGWSRAFDVVRAGKMTGWQKFASDKFDLESRAKAAPQVLEGLKTNEAIFAELRAASQRPFSRYPINYSLDDPYEILLPHLGKVRGTCRRLELKACAELATGRNAEALEDMKLIFRLSDSLKEDPFVISYLVRIACVQAAIQSIWEGLAQHAWSETQLRELQTHLQSYSFVAGLKLPLDAERAAGVDIIDSIQNHGMGVLIDSFGPGQPIPLGERIASFFGRITPSGWWSQEKINYCHFFELQMEGAYDRINQRVDPSRARSNEDKLDQAFDGRNPFGTIFIRHQLISTIMVRSLGNMPRKAAAAQTASDQATIACALERYRLAHGQFPDTLNILTPQFISQLPHDVITGDPYKYRRTPDDQFVLYSVGWNEKDDGGVEGKYLFDESEGDWVWQYPSK